MNKSRTRKAGLFVFGVIVCVVVVFLFKDRIGVIVIPKKEIPLQTQEQQEDLLAQKLGVPDGFKISTYARNLNGPRVIVFDPKNRLIVSETKEGKVVRLVDADNDGFAEIREVIISDVPKPHGLALACNDQEGATCILYVATHNTVDSYVYDIVTGALSNKKKLIDIPASATDRHYTRSLLWDKMTPSLLYVSVGSSCDVCKEKDPFRAGISVYNIEKKTIERYATGLRNAVFMTINPKDNSIVATEMGRDGLGDELPPDEINTIIGGNDYGWPICFGNNIHDKQYDKNTYIRNPCTKPFTTPSLIDLPAHSAPLGLTFVTNNLWPKKYLNGLIVAYHGSWNRSIPTGYKLVFIGIREDGTYMEPVDFVTGWLTSDGTKIGRPVGLAFGNDEALYVSDDTAGVIYRIEYEKE